MGRMLWLTEWGDLDLLLQQRARVRFLGARTGRCMLLPSNLALLLLNWGLLIVCVCALTDWDVACGRLD